jgi:hypothetical protein
MNVLNTVLHWATLEICWLTVFIKCFGGLFNVVSLFYVYVWVMCSSTHTQLPYDYYSLKFCKPAEGVESYSENLGEFLSGDRIENSAYEVVTTRIV